ncbi:MAG: hypothetical protein J6D53_02440 [Blautia sp.]|nr:hypothetical protein [Blautia sp.]
MGLKAHGRFININYMLINSQTFYLIKQPVKENGITALVSNVMGIIGMLRAKRPDFIPVVDLGVANDPNQFTGKSGEDVWGMFFKQVSP